MPVACVVSCSMPLGAKLIERNYYDIFMFDLDGNLIYSVFKETDYGTNFRRSESFWASGGFLEFVIGLWQLGVCQSDFDISLEHSRCGTRNACMR